MLLEIHLNDDGAAFAREIAETLPIGHTRTRQILNEMAESGLVSVRDVADVNIYSLTEQGYDTLVQTLREEID
jgi:DNA-binding PadR family transcriptional regulator